MLTKLIFLKNTIISISPGILSIFISLFSLPIFLNFLSSAYFGQFIIQNLFLTLGFVFNFGIYRLVIINSSVLKKTFVKSNNTNYLQINIVLSLISSLFIFLLIYIINTNLKLPTLSLILNKYIFFGLILSSIFFTLESVQKVNGRFYQLAFFNLSFNAISFSAPAFYLLIKKTLDDAFNILSYPDELILIVVAIKGISLVSFYLLAFFQNQIGNIFILSKKIIFSKKEINEIFYATSQSFIFFLNNLTDKFFVKITLGNSFLTMYSVPQQIAAKSTILITGISSVFFPKVSKIRTTLRKKSYLKYVVRITIFFSGFICFVSYPFIDPVIKLWLGDSYIEKYTFLIKVFLFYSLFASLNFLISQYLDSENNIKVNSIIDISFFLISLFFFIVSMQYKSLLLFASSICAREVLLLIYKSYYYKLINILKDETVPLLIFSLFLIIGLYITNILFYLVTIILMIIYLLYFLKIKNILIFFKNLIYKFNAAENK